MARLDETISAGQAGHISDSQILARKANYVYDVMDYGATGDGVTDDSTAIQAAITAAEAATPTGTIHFSAKSYKIDTGLTILDCNISKNQGASLIVADSVAAGITIGANGSSCDNHRYDFPDIAPVTRDWDSTPTIGTQRGIVFALADNCISTIGAVTNFSYGLVLEGDGGGVAYNTFLLNKLLNNAIQLYISNVNSGWSNQNTFIGGQCGYTNIGGTPPYAGTRHMYLAGNNNVFLGTSLEGDIYEYALEIDSSYNRWVSCRWEATVSAVKYGSSAWYNVIDGGYDSDNIVVTADVASRYNSIQAPRKWTFEGGATDESFKMSNISTDATGIAMFSGNEPLTNKTTDEYLVRVAAAVISAKGEADSFDRFYLNTALGRLYFGDGTSNPTSNGYMRYNAGFLEITDPIRVQAAGALYAGAGTPESSQAANVGSIFMRTDGGAGTSMYVKELGTGSTGWVAK